MEENYFKTELVWPDPAFVSKQEIFSFIESNPYYVSFLWVDIVEANGGFVGVTYRKKIQEEMKKQFSIVENSPENRVRTTIPGVKHPPKRKDLREVEHNNLIPELKGKDHSHPLFDKRIVFTGLFNNINRNFAAIKAKEKGADVNTAISNKTDFVCVGDDAGWKKLETIKQMQSEGHHIRILSEDDFIKMIGI